MTLSFKTKARPIRPRGRQALITVHRDLTRLWRDSVKEFIVATADAMAVDTGMSVASLEPLAAKVRLATLIREISRGKGPKRGHKNLTGNFSSNNAQFKSRNFGRQLGREAFDLSFGTPQSPVLTFNFKIVVFQHFLQENGLGNGDVWASLAKGREAFLTFFNTEAPRRIDGNKISRIIFGETLS
jgi:hypothetical protein